MRSSVFLFLFHSVKPSTLTFLRMEVQNEFSSGFSWRSSYCSFPFLQNQNIGGNYRRSKREDQDLGEHGDIERHRVIFCSITVHP